MESVTHPPGQKSHPWIMARLPIPLPIAWSTLQARSLQLLGLHLLITTLSFQGYIYLWITYHAQRWVRVTRKKITWKMFLLKYRINAVCKEGYHILGKEKESIQNDFAIKFSILWLMRRWYRWYGIVCAQRSSIIPHIVMYGPQSTVEPLRDKCGYLTPILFNFSIRRVIFCTSYLSAWPHNSV